MQGCTEPPTVMEAAPFCTGRLLRRMGGGLFRNRRRGFGVLSNSLIVPFRGRAHNLVETPPKNR